MHIARPAKKVKREEKEKGNKELSGASFLLLLLLLLSYFFLSVSSSVRLFVRADKVTVERRREKRGLFKQSRNGKGSQVTF